MSDPDEDAWMDWIDDNGEVQACGGWPHVYSGLTDPVPTADDIRRGSPGERRRQRGEGR